MTIWCTDWDLIMKFSKAVASNVSIQMAHIFLLKRKSLKAKVSSAVTRSSELHFLPKQKRKRARVVSSREAKSAK